MGILSRAKTVANSLLRFANARIDSLTAERAEQARLAELERAGHFLRPVYPILPAFEACSPSAIFDQIKRDESKFGELISPGPASSYPLVNDYYTTPDAEVLHAIVQLYRPARIIEIGSGYSTQLFRLAIRDAALNTHLTSIDPNPRQDIDQYSDQVIKEQVEKLSDLTLFKHLEPNDILFIDSSHEIKAGNDVLHLFLKVLPNVPEGVLVHIHDIFLPFEYPKQWLIEQRWDFFKEQYLVHAFLIDNSHFQVIWAGYYLQRTMRDFSKRFAQWREVDARSLWLRKAVGSS